MDCAEEVAILKRELGELVGGDDRLAFDILNGKLVVHGDESAVSAEAVIQGVARTGMRAEIWKDESERNGPATLWQQYGRAISTVVTGLFGAAGLLTVALGYVLLSQGSITAAPLLLVLGYVILLPLAIILIAPLSISFALLGVALNGIDNNIFVQIGFVVLIGLACKNAVLIVEFAKHERDHGKSRKEAAIEASRLRLRPILMTSFAFILGVLPLALAVEKSAVEPSTGMPAMKAEMSVSTTLRPSAARTFTAPGRVAQASRPSSGTWLYTPSSTARSV